MCEMPAVLLLFQSISLSLDNIAKTMDLHSSQIIPSAPTPKGPPRKTHGLDSDTDDTQFEPTEKRPRLNSISLSPHLPFHNNPLQDSLRSQSFILENDIPKSPSENNSQDTDSENDLVLSEVHIHPNNGRVDGRFLTSTFSLSKAGQDPRQDSIQEHKTDLSDEDAEAQEDPPWDYALEIQHAMGTTLRDVGSQVWMGCFLLVDWMVSIRDHLSGSFVLELGAGTGLASIALCLMTDVEKVFCTDYDVEVLLNCERNIALNSESMISDHPVSTHLDQRVLPRRYNWLMDDPTTCPDETADRFSWTDQEHEEWRTKGAVIFAADVVYDDSLTDALIRCLEKLLLEPLPEDHPRHTTGRVAYLTMEKRYNFSLDQLAVVATAHDYFVKKTGQSEVIMAQRMDYSQLNRHCDYDRSKDLELYRVVLRR
ncbi:hypothetical protein BC939DRAFT_456937 [Gamsiella multidivaricata]|uniref:uncharacterized protein n=1 Tax=Gamsiella multidivaricata TaxID=101098 RepID=UPI0022211320|nr:uncharacterized protein BC939DRAFT_456937 [Gamsiella multidivaricata]KAI7820786.1 hypothetical protein BC939DRAFT_456937 [Gamsiella multidivaricata]